MEKEEEIDKALVYPINTMDFLNPLGCISKEKSMIKFLFAGFLGLICSFSEMLMADESVKIVTYRGADIAPYSKEIVRLFNTVFREYPYLYAGNDADYEEVVLA